MDQNMPGRHELSALHDLADSPTEAIPPVLVAPAEPPSAHPAPYAPSSPLSAPQAPAAPIERKVAFAAFWAILASAGAVLLQQLAENVAALSFLPSWATLVVVVVAPPVAAALAGYAAGHTQRPDLSGQ